MGIGVEAVLGRQALLASGPRGAAGRCAAASGRGPLLLGVLLAALALLAGRHALLPYVLPTARQAVGPRARLDGRLWPGPDSGGNVGELPQLMTWPSSAATLAFENATWVAVDMDGRLESLPPPSQPFRQAFGGFPRSRILFELDGEPAGELLLTDKEQTWRQEGLGPGRHQLKVAKVSHTRFGAAWLQRVSLSPGGRFLPPPASPGSASGRRILFVGDSITLGSGAAGEPTCSGNSLVDTNSQLAFGPLLARKYEADFQMLAWGGAPMVAHSHSHPPKWTDELNSHVMPSMQRLLRRTNAHDPAPTYRPSDWVPQVVVLAAGINDFFATAVGTGRGSPHFLRLDPGPVGPRTMQEWVDGFEALVREIRSAYPDAAIITMAWPLEVPLAGLHPLERTIPYLQSMAAAASRLQQAAIPNTFFLQLDGTEFAPTGHCAMHPAGGIHAQVADQLAAFVDGALPWFGGGGTGGR